MTIVDSFGLGFALLALLSAGCFFWFEKNIAGFAFIAAFIIAIAGVLEQRVVLSSIVLGLTVERASLSPKSPTQMHDN